MKKKWITKAEITKILKTYSIRKDEFEPVGSIDYFYQSRLVKGYTISVEPEKHEAPDYYHETGRIIVSHTQYNGKKTFNDIWERDRDGKMQFRFRNLWNQPIFDAECIQDLEEENKRLLLAGRDLQKRLSEYSCEKSHKLISDFNAAEITELKKQLCDLKEKYQKLKDETNMHNARGAGRKPSQERLNSIAQVKDLLASGCSDKDIIDKLGISRATFYRYKKVSKINYGNLKLEIHSVIISGWIFL